MDSIENEVQFCRLVLKTHHFTDEEHFKLGNILQRYVLFREIKDRKRKGFK
jgi:hypothetical protein